MVVRQGISVGFWNAMPTPLIGPFTFSPATRTSPADAGSRPVTSFMMVDLPQPDGPDDGDELALVDAERGIGKGERRLLAQTVGETDALEIDEGHLALLKRHRFHSANSGSSPPQGERLGEGVAHGLRGPLT